MQAQAPKLIAITHDQYDANLVGRTQNGLQVSPLHHLCPLLGGEAGREFRAIYLFDAKARL